MQEVVDNQQVAGKELAHKVVPKVQNITALILTSASKCSSCFVLINIDVSLVSNNFTLVNFDSNTQSFFILF